MSARQTIDVHASMHIMVEHGIGYAGRKKGSCRTREEKQKKIMHLLHGADTATKEQHDVLLL